jgi:hypothetical protein
MVHVPVEGNPLKATLPVGTSHVGWTIVPITGAVGLSKTVNVYVALAAAQGAPDGLSVVMVIITVFPTSPFLGVYVKENGDVFEEVGLTEPPPSSLMVTFVALPPKALSVTVTGVVLHVLPDVLLRVNAGGFVHCPNPVAEIYKRKITEGKAFLKINSLILLFLEKKTRFISDVFHLTGGHL